MFNKWKYVTVFADASFCDRTCCYGWAVWIKYGNPPEVLRLMGGGCRVARSSNREWEITNSTQAEKFALDTAVRALDYYKVPYEDKIVVIQSDCDKGLNSIKIRPIKRKAKEVRFKHVKGHRGFACPRSSVNTWCDRQARRKMREYRKALLDNERRT